MTLEPELQHQLDRFNRKQARRARPWYLLWFVLLFALLGTYVWYDSDRGAGRFETTTQNSAENRALITELQSQTSTLQTLYDTLYTKFEQCTDVSVAENPDCASPGTPAPDDVDSSPVLPNILNPIAVPPSAQQVEAAVVAYCASPLRCEPSGPTDVQISAAIQTYCGTGVCRGPQGELGPVADPLPPLKPTGDELAAAVANYCTTTGQCVGPPGPEGPQGPQGPPGPICPEGYTQAELLVLTLGEPANILACVMNQTPVEPEEPTGPTEPVPTPTA